MHVWRKLVDIHRSQVPGIHDVAFLRIAHLYTAEREEQVVKMPDDKFNCVPEKKHHSGAVPGCSPLTRLGVC